MRRLTYDIKSYFDFIKLFMPRHLPNASKIHKAYCPNISKAILMGFMKQDAN